MRAVNERCALPEMPLSLKLTLLIAAHAAPVSYTHLTLPTILLV